jgi:hypothetical protein
MSTPAGLILDDDATTQLQYINGTEAQWVTFSAVGANGESITTQVNICPSTGACSLTASTVDIALDLRGAAGAGASRAAGVDGYRRRWLLRHGHATKRETDRKSEKRSGALSGHSARIHQLPDVGQIVFCVNAIPNNSLKS